MVRQQWRDWRRKSGNDWILTWLVLVKMKSGILEFDNTLFDKENERQYLSLMEWFREQTMSRIDSQMMAIIWNIGM